MYFNVSLIRVNLNGVSVSYDFTLSFAQPILFTVPRNLKMASTNISNEVASSITAKIVDRVMAKTDGLFAGTEASKMQVEQYFRAELKREYQMSIPGARVNFNSMERFLIPRLFKHK